MHIMSRFTLLHLKRNKKHALFSIFAIFIATLFISTLCFYAYSSNQSELKQIINEGGDWHAEFYTNLPGESLPYIEENPEVSKVMAKTDFYLQKLEKSSGRPYLAHIDLDENYTKDMGMADIIVEGRMANKPNEIAISEDFFRDNPEYQLGDILIVQEGDRVKEGQRIGVLDRLEEGENFTSKGEERSYTIVGMVDASVEYSEVPVYISMGYNNQRLASREYVVYVKLHDFKNVYEIMPRLAENIGLDTDSKGYYPLRYNTYLLECYGILGNTVGDRFMSMMILYTMIGLVVAGFFIVIIYHTFAVSAHSRVRNLGLLKSVGATPRQIIESVLIEGLLVSCIGIPLGLVGGYGCATLIAYYFNQLTGVLEMNMRIEMSFAWWVMVVIVIITLVIVMVSAYLPARKVARLSPIVAIKQGDHKVEKLKTTRFLQWIEKRCAYEIVLVLKSHRANRKGLRTAYVSLALSFVMVVGACIYVNVADLSIRKNPRAARYDMKIMLTDVGDEEASSLGKKVRQIEKIEGVQRERGGIYAHHQVAEAELSHELKDKGLKYLKEENELVDGKYDFVAEIITLDEESFEDYCEEIGVDPELFNQINGTRAILYNSGLYDITAQSDKIETLPLFNWEVGHKINLIEDKKEEPYQFDVEIGYITHIPLKHRSYYDYYRTILIMPESMSKEIAGQLSEVNERRYNRELTYIDVAYEDIPEVKEEIETIYARHKDKSNYRLWDQITADASQDKSTQFIVGMIAAGGGFIVLIGIVNIYSTISAQLLARRKEFAVLKSIGISPEGIRKILLLESNLYAIKPILYGTPLLIGFGLFLLNMTRMAYKYIFVIFPYDVFCVGGGILAGAVFGINYMLMKKIQKESIIEVIKDEVY